MIAFAIFYTCLVVVIAAYGTHRYWLVWGATRRRSSEVPSPFEAERPREFPRVLVQLPIFNEPELFRRLIDHAIHLDWPRERLEIQVLDDSTDGSSDEVRLVCEHLKSSGVPIEHIHRTDRTGYKAGALEAGMKRSDAEFIAIFDADFVIPRDFLRRAIPRFDADNIAMVQGRWGFTNREDSALTRTQALMLDGHFHVEHRARSRAGRFFNFNGTAGVWRKAAIEDAGGWCADTVTEDLELSLRAWQRGWRFRYAGDLVCPSELPEAMRAFKIQQNRWVSGSIHVAVRELPNILRSSMSLRQKFDLAFYLTGNFVYPFLLLLVVAMPPSVLARSAGSPFWLGIDLPFLLFATASIAVFYGSARPEARRRATFWFRDVPTLMALGLGMTLHNTRAVLRGASGKQRTFDRTPKRNLQFALGAKLPSRPSGDSVEKVKKGRRDRIVWGEGILTGYLTIALGLAITNESYASLPFLSLFVVGHALVFFGSTIRPRVESGEAPTSVAASPMPDASA